MARKNWHFSGSDEGAINAAILFSVIVSCRLADVDPFADLHDIPIRRHTHPASRVHELLPREWKGRFATPALQPIPAVA